MTGVAMDRAVAAWASAHHGVIGKERLDKLGMTRSALRWRVHRGSLHAVEGCPGVFAVGHTALSWEGRVLAGLLASGPRGCAVTGDHATHLWGLAPPWVTRPEPPVHLVVPLGCRRDVPAASPIRRTLRRDETTLRHGVRTVTVARLLLDEAARLEPWAHERLVDRALTERKVTRRALERQIDRAPGQRGTPRLRDLLEAERRYAGLTRSALEEAFLSVLRRAGIEPPGTDVKLGRDRVDALFTKAKLVVELDGTTWHRTRRRQDGDRAREMRLRARGLTVVRYTARQVFEEPERVVADLVRLLVERTH